MKRNVDAERVIIAGAGPVGLCAAVYLAQQGIPTTVLEADASLPTDLRASTFHPPTLDMLDQFGVTQALMDWGLLAPTWQYRDRQTGPVATFDLAALRDVTNHPYRVQSEQWKLTRLLLKKLQDMGAADVRFGHAVVDATQDADYATVEATTPDGKSEHLVGRYVIGAEGSKSPIRRALGLEFEGFTIPEMYLTLSTTFEFADHFPGLTYVNYLSDPDEWLVLLRVRDHWRVLLPTDAAMPRETVYSEAEVQRRLNRVVKSDRPYDVVHRTLYTVHERVVPTYRVGRIALAGDAAHINNPLGGMGMNGGVHDAFNLAEKLTKVWRGEADAGLLDRYSRQRRMVAVEYVQANALRNRQILNERDPAVRLQRQDELRRTAESPALAKEYLLKTSMITALRDAEAVQ
ncbi:MAG: FAD-dependent oxidoreductase [Alphaproteobacteria bacterium]